MIKVQNLTKFYSSKRALGPVSFEIEAGETVGFLGLNGAGKTTALRILACDLRPSAGAVQIGALDALASPHEVRKLIGFLPETTPLYRDMRVTDYLLFAGRIRGMSKAATLARMPKVIDLTNLDDVADDPINSLSHGYRQRVGVAQAIIHEPKLLILDEPTRGLDPVQIVDMRAMIHQLKKDHTVLISSHILPEISQTCDRLLVLGHGEIIAAGSETALSADLMEAKRVQIVVNGSARANAEESEKQHTLEQLRADLTDIEGVDDIDTHIEGERYVAHLTCSAESRPAIARALVANDWELLVLDQAHSQLESIFLSLVEGDAHSHGSN